MANADDIIALCNQSLYLLGAKPITALDQGTKEANLCNALYDLERQNLLRAHLWNFATRRATLFESTLFNEVDSYTKLLLHMNGADEAVAFTDDGDTGHTITANGDVKVDTSIKKVNTGSAVFDGTGDYLSAPNHADWYMATGKFTIDFWVRFADITGSQGLFGQSDDSNNRWELVYNAASSTLSFDVRDTAVSTVDISGTFAPAAYTWYHIAVIRGWGGNANDWAITVDGTAIDTTTDADEVPDYDAVFTVGGSRIGEASPYYFTGNIDEFRVSKGIARWTANFTATEDLSTPVFGYTYTYALPLDCLRTLQMEYLEYVFKIEHGCLLTDESPAEIIYISDEETVSRFDQLFYNSLVLKLAWAMAWPLTHSATFTKEMQGEFIRVVSEARSVDGQEGTPPEFEVDTWLNVR